MSNSSQNQASPNAAARVKRLRAGFFGSGNRITLSSLLSSSHANAQCARLWNDQLDENGDDGQPPSVVLPRKTSGLTQWYGIAFTPTQNRDLREQLTAFVGPTLSNFRGLSHPLDINEPVEAAIAEVIGAESTTACFSAVDVKTGEELTDALQLMARVRQGVQIRETELVISTGRVLRRFEWALRAGNRAEAEERLAYLRCHRRLDPLNLQFLEVQLRAALGMWSEIVTLPHFLDLVQARRPRAVTQALLHALYADYLAPGEALRDADALLQAFEREVRPRSGTLFSSFISLRPTPSPAVFKSFLVLAVFDQDTELGAQSWETLQELQTSAEAMPDNEFAFWKAFLERIPSAVTTSTPSPTSSSLSEATRAVFDGDLDRAWTIAVPLEASPTRAHVLLHCAVTLGTLDARRTAQGAMDSLDEAARTTLLANHSISALWNQLFGGESKQVGDSGVEVVVPSNWTQWLELVPNMACSDARLNLFASQGADEWAVETLLAKVEQVDSAARLLEELSNGAQTQHRLLDGLPHLLRFLERDDLFPRPAFKSLYNRLRTILAYYGDTGDLPQWSVYADLVRLVLGLGISPTGYRELLDETQHLWGGRLAVANIGAALDTLDSLFIFSCPPAEIEQRSSLAQMVFSQATTWLDNSHLDDETRRFCRQLAADYGLSEILVNEAETAGELSQTSDPLAVMNGKMVAIYTLTESAAIRARDLLAVRCPSCAVQLNHDKVGTDNLRNLAQSAQIFVMVTASAKHAATDFIETHRTDKNTLLRVHAKGSSSILRALAEYAVSFGETN